MTSTAPVLPRWEMTPFFPSLDSPEFAAAFASFGEQLGELEVLWSAHSVDRTAALPADEPSPRSTPCMRATRACSLPADCWLAMSARSPARIRAMTRRSA